MQSAQTQRVTVYLLRVCERECVRVAADTLGWLPGVKRVWLGSVRTLGRAVAAPRGPSVGRSRRAAAAVCQPLPTSLAG